MITLDELLREPHLTTAKKLLAVDQVPSYEEVSALVAHVDGLQIGEYQVTWNTFCIAKGITHALCYEFVEGLAAEITKLHITGPVVEVAAGTGKLSHWLRKFGVPSLATDSYTDGGITRNPLYVERLSHDKALQNYKPELVIGCWLDVHSTIALDVLDSPHLRHYLDIGEGRGGCTGDPRLWDRNDISVSSLDSIAHFSISRTQISLARLFTKI